MVAKDIEGRKLSVQLVDHTHVTGISIIISSFKRDRGETRSE